MNTNLNISRPLEFELLKMAQTFDKTEKMMNFRRNKERTINDTKSRISDMKLCISELRKLNKCESFILSLRCCGADIYEEKQLLDKESIMHAVFMYPFGKREELYRINLTNNKQLIGFMELLDRDLFRNDIKKLTKIKPLSNSISTFPEVINVEKEI